ncbi:MULTISPECIES: hypothetical protein [unclassified Sphingomonas]|jgi:hypothetical protein|uniref:hypothetical protein n=1 Tax=unclassified Sphingomonas TaxID=196159 RepID=UPI00082B971A|nr:MULTISPECIES: hypothetical protein [unclassified Sphingomonas]
MLEFRPGAGAVVAADTKNAVAAVDDALLQSARLCASIIEASQGSNLPISRSQKLYKSMAQGLNRVVEGRGDLVDTIRELTLIKEDSNFASANFGCPDGWVPGRYDAEASQAATHA